MKKQHLVIIGKFLGLFAFIWIATTIPNGDNLIIAAPSVEDNRPFETISLPQEALTWSIDSLSQITGKHNPKIDTTIARLAFTVKKTPEKALSFARSQSLNLIDNRVQVQIIYDSSGLMDVVHVINESGGEITAISNYSDLIQGWLPIDKIETVAADENILFIRRPAELVTLNDMQTVDSTSEGLSVMNATSWHDAGYKGDDVKIGIIDGGFWGTTVCSGVICR